MVAQSDLQIAQPLTLKCGLTLPNRLVKAAMAEQMAGAKQLPDEHLQAVYRHWSTGGWGLIITGHVHVDDAHLGTPSDPAIPPSLPLDSLLPAYSALARAAQGVPPGPRKTPTIVQLNHPGRQSPRGAGTRGLFAPALAPSAVPVSLGSGLLAWLARVLAFGTPREMTRTEIATVVSQFARAARVCAEAGFDGVEIHAAHGYLLSQFLSPKSNLRQDEYGGDAQGRARAVVEVVRAVKEAVKEYDGFCVGIKLNSVDHQGTEGDLLADCVEQVRALAEAGVDFIEISGGSYEDMRMVTGNASSQAEEQKSERTKAREAFFLEFAKIIRKEVPDVPLLVTGGFSSRGGMDRAVADGDCDLIGLARPSVLNPSLPNNLIFNPEVKDQDAVIYRKKNQAPWIVKFIGISAVGAGMETQWYSEQIQTMSKT
ncbi:hypothetical protein VTI28DRAFT_3093 [Corynascus sepedonium]